LRIDLGGWPDMSRRTTSPSSPAAENTLFAVYDLQVSPVSFDFSGFLVVAEQHRVDQELDHLYIVIVPPGDEEGHHDNKQFSVAHISWRMNNIILPLCELLTSYSGICICQTRQQAAGLLSTSASPTFPEHYSVEAPISRHHTGWSVLAGHLGQDIQKFRATDQARTYARRWIDAHADGRKCVSLTLREAPFIPSRNSDLGVWGDFAGALLAEGFFPIVLRDIDTALDVPPPELEGIATFPEGTFNLALRLGLYEECYINTFVANGPAQVCFYNKNVHFLYNLTGDWLERKPSSFGRMGIHEGETPPFLNKYQRWIWQHQSAEVLFEAYQELDADLKQDQSDGTYETNLDPVANNRIPILTFSERLSDWAHRTYETSHEEIELAEACLDWIPDAEVSEQDSLRRLINLALSTRQLEKAAGLLEAFIEKYERTPDVLIQLGVVSEAMNDYQSALQHYQEAAAIGETSPQVLYRLGVVHRHLGDFAKAREFLQLLVDKGSRYPELLFELGQAYEGLGDPVTAQRYYEQAESIAPGKK